MTYLLAGKKLLLLYLQGLISCIFDKHIKATEELNKFKIKTFGFSGKKDKCVIQIIPERVLIEEVWLENVAWVLLLKKSPKGRVEFCCKKNQLLLAFIRDNFQYKLECKWHDYLTVK